MGLRKRETSNNLKNKKRDMVQAVLRNCPISSRKVRLVLDLIRDKKVKDSFGILKYVNKESSIFVEKLLLSAVSNWQSKNKDKDIENVDLYIKEVYAGEATMLKRIQPAPQGRVHRIRKRRSHITLVVDSKN